MSGGRLAARSAALVLCVLATAVCGEQGSFQSSGGVVGPSGPDPTPPTGAFTPALSGSPRAAGDSVLVGFRATDGVGVKTIALRGFGHRGVDSLGTGVDVIRYTETSTTFTTGPRDTTIYRYLQAVLTDSTVEKVYIAATVTDVSGNITTVRDSITIVPGPYVRLLAPANGATHPVGVPLTITVNGRDPDSLVYLGYETIGADTVADSTAIAPQDDSTSRSLVLLTTAASQTGNLTITPFARDKFGNRFTGAARTVVLSDTAKPVVTILDPTTPDLPVRLGDQAGIRVRVQDNRGVSLVSIVGVAHRGVDSLGTGEDVERYAPKFVAMTSAPSDTAFTRLLVSLADTLTSERVYVIVSAQDASGNVGIDTTTLLLVGGPSVEILRPSVGAQTAPGKSVAVEVRAIDPQGVALLGYSVTGVYNFRDSIIYTPSFGRLQDTVTWTDTLLIPLGTPLGTITIAPFARDSAADRSGAHLGVQVTVATTAIDVTPPAISFSVLSRVETDDSITVSATDAGGITIVGFIARLVGGGVIATGSSPYDPTAQYSDVQQTFSLNLPAGLSFPAQVEVSAFASDINNIDTTVAETLTVVAGKTYALPSGSDIGDAIYNENRQELYLANTTYDRIEIFDLATSSFVAYVPVGSRPTGLALMPRDTLGNYKDTLIVANSGGTNLSIVDLVTRREAWRHRLPNYDVQTVKTKTNQGGGLDIVITHYEYSDRPYQLAALCVTSVSANCDRVRVLYSTSPTRAQSVQLRGYLAWTEINAAAAPNLGDHLMYEHSSDGADTLQIFAIKDTMPGEEITDTILGAGVGRTVSIGTLPMQEQTFVRGSGSAVHALIGEGGSADFARVLTYDVRPGRADISILCPPLLGTILACGGLEDQGVSPTTQVSDFVANRASRVTSISINHNGRTNLVRADSIYAFDYVLRQTGMMQISAANDAVGMDFHPCNNFDATFRTSTPLPGCAASYTPSERMVFAARPDSSLDVFDTYFYGRVTDTTLTASTIPIPIRNALLGPVRVAAGPANTVLFGFTAFGLVVVDLPTVANSLFPVRSFISRP